MYVALDEYMGLSAIGRGLTYIVSVRNSVHNDRLPFRVIRAAPLPYRNALLHTALASGCRSLSQPITNPLDHPLEKREYLRVASGQ